MPDLGEKMTEKRYAQLADDIKKTYAEASRDMAKKLKDFEVRYAAADKKMRARVESGKMTDAQYKVWQMGKVFVGRQWKNKVSQMKKSLANADKTALKLVRTGQFDIYADNANYFDFRIDKDHNMTLNFGLYSPETVRMLITDTPELLRRREIDGVKQDAWNTKIIANAVTQGIIQGESIDKIAKRIAQDTASTDMKSMIRYARTACTAAQNAGRIQSMHDAERMGIKVQKEWISTGDMRVRPAHEELDGQVVNVDESFENEIGPIMYPGDPDADGDNIWNCRCALGYYYPDYDRYSPSGYDSLEEEEYEDWLDEY